MDLFEQELRRYYYFCEAMAFYEAYYSPAAEYITNSAPKQMKDALALEGREQDHPLTWVPIVFHCTTFNSFATIVRDGIVKQPVHLTEMPIGELDRMKIRTSEADQIAIGFPRRYVQTRNAASVLHTKHNPELTQFLRDRPDIRGLLSPFLALDDDVSAFQELRTSQPLEIAEAVWLLTTKRDDQKRPIIPSRNEFTERWGKIPSSFWHRTHQMEVLGEWQYLRVSRQNGKPTSFEVIGEHYWKQQSFKEEEQLIQMPRGKDWLLRFKSRTESSCDSEGPFTFFDVSKRMRSLLRDHLQSILELPYALMKNL